MNGRALDLGVLIALGAGWGFTMPMTKIAVSGGYQHYGLIFWQLLLSCALLIPIVWWRRRGLQFTRKTVPVYVILALVGTLIPNTASYQAAAHLPAGIISILYSMIPMLAFPLALALGVDRYETRRLGGLTFGLVGVLLIVVPGQSLSGAIPAFWVMVVLFTAACYAFEGNYVARWGTAGLDPFQVLLGASLVGLIFAVPLVAFTGQWIDPRPPWNAPDYALMASSVAHVMTYVGYVWLVGRAGVVFTAQVSYLVTLFGLFWARLILSEYYSATVWISLALMCIGMYLVQPRSKAALAAPKTMRNTRRARN